MSHSSAVNVALAVGDELDRLVAQMGTADNPDGEIVQAYRMARAEIAKARTRDDMLGALYWLQRMVSAVMYRLLSDARDRALGYTDQMLGVYDIPRATAPVDATRAYWRAWAASLEAQIGAAEVLLQTSTADAELVIGDGDRVGLLSPGRIVSDGARWAAFAMNNTMDDAILFSLIAAPSKTEYKRQVVAVVDDRTTDCCLRANGQVVGIDEDFKLTGIPAFAGQMRNPPFHYF